MTHSAIGQTPSCSEEESERYLLYDRSEICAQLKYLSRRPEIITAHFNGGNDVFLTAVLEVIRERNLIVLDCAHDRKLNRAAINSGKLFCSARHNGIPIRFSCEQLQSARFQAQPAIAAEIPQSMHRVQRREFFRVATPLENAPRCRIVDPENGKYHLLTICDISAGGLGMLQRLGAPRLATQTNYRNCRLILPTEGEMTVDIMLRYNLATNRGNGDIAMRYGASFEKISVADSAAVQRYIYSLQANAPGGE